MLLVSKLETDSLNSTPIKQIRIEMEMPWKSQLYNRIIGPVITIHNAINFYDPN